MTALALTQLSEPRQTVSLQLVHRCSPRATCVSSRTIALMKTEAARVWSSLDVRLEWTGSRPSTTAEEPGITVMLEDGTISGPDNESVLASLIQPLRNCGWSVAHVWVRHAERFAAWTTGANRLSGLPIELKEEFLGRALGRALAHEIGHYVLGTSTHATKGLMRSTFLPQDLLEDATSPLYGLDYREKAALITCRLVPTLEANTEPGPVSRQ